MKKEILTALMAGALVAGAGAVSADPQPYGSMNRGHDNGRMDNMRHDDHGNMGRDDDRWGRWDNGWGRRPDGPPRGWTNHRDWYRHVHACQMRYRSYMPRTDMYRTARGGWMRCRL